MKQSAWAWETYWPIRGIQFWWLTDWLTRQWYTTDVSASKNTIAWNTWTNMSTISSSIGRTRSVLRLCNQAQPADWVKVNYFINLVWFLWKWRPKIIDIATAFSSNLFQHWRDLLTSILYIKVKSMILLNRSDQIRISHITPSCSISN